MKTKNYYQRKIAIYKQRRQAIRDQYGTAWNRCPECIRRCATINKRIKLWGRSIRIIEKRMVKIWELNNSVCEFFGINKTCANGVMESLRHKGHSKERRYSMAKKVFCAYAIDHRMGTDTLADFLGFATASGPYLIRKRFKKGLAKNQQDLVIWHRFLAFIKSEQLEKAA